MIFFSLTTNIPNTEINIETLKETSKFISQMLEIAEENVLISIRPDMKMSWGPRNAPVMAIGSLQISSINSEETKRYAPAIFDFLEKKLRIPQNRMYFGFMSFNSDNIAYGGKLLSRISQE